MTSDDDPGWPRGISILVFLVPGMMQRQLRRENGDGLITLRYVMLSFSFALVMFGVVLPFIDSGRNSLLPWLPILVVLAGASLGTSRLLENPLDCTSDTTLAGSYRTRFFVRIAFSDVIALIAFVAVVSGAPLWIYYAGTAVTLFRLWTSAAPTRVALAHDQQQLEATGCVRSLVAALRTAPYTRRS